MCVTAHFWEVCAPVLLERANTLLLLVQSGLEEHNGLLAVSK
jgi:hypothetical protein